MYKILFLDKVAMSKISDIGNIWFHYSLKKLFSIKLN